MNGGYRVNPISILKVTDSNGKVLEENKPQKGNSVITPEQAFIISDILSDNNARSMAFGLSSYLNIPGRTVAVKTGTTNDKRDNWTVGGNINGLAGVWVGNNDNSAMLQVASGVTGASPIWNRIIQRVLKDKPNTKFTVPSGIVKEDVDVISGAKAHDNWPSRSEYFVKGTEPQGPDTVHTNLKICKSDGKLATPSDVAANNYDTKEYYVFKEEDPTAASGGENKWQQAILDWENTQSDYKYHPPTDYCGTANPVNVDFQSPHDQDGNLNSSFDIRVSASSTTSITGVDFYIDGNQIGSVNSLPYQINSGNLSNGNHQIRAVAKDSNGKSSDRTINIAVGTGYNSSPSPTP
jgi:membrane carboxypeptidase/penicillin-binding protein PbpC